MPRLTKIIDSQYSDYEYELAIRERAKMKVEISEKTMTDLKAYSIAKNQWLHSKREDFEDLDAYLDNQLATKAVMVDLCETFAISAAIDIDMKSLDEGYYNATEQQVNPLIVDGEFQGMTKGRTNAT